MIKRRDRLEKFRRRRAGPAHVPQKSTDHLKEVAAVKHYPAKPSSSKKTISYRRLKLQQNRQANNNVNEIKDSPEDEGCSPLMQGENNSSPSSIAYKMDRHPHLKSASSPMLKDSNNQSIGNKAQNRQPLTIESQLFKSRNSSVASKVLAKEKNLVKDKIACLEKNGVSPKDKKLYSSPVKSQRRSNSQRKVEVLITPPKAPSRDLNKGRISPDRSLLDDDSDDNDCDDYSYAKLHCMWLERDKQPLKVSSPTSTTPLQYLPSSLGKSLNPILSASSPPRAGNSLPGMNDSYNGDINDILQETNANDFGVEETHQSSTSCNYGVKNIYDLESTKLRIIDRFDKSVDANPPPSSPPKTKIPEINNLKKKKNHHGSLNDFMFHRTDETRKIEDPYMNFDSMSTTYSDATVKVENTHNTKHQKFLNFDAKQISTPNASNVTSKSLVRREREQPKTIHFDDTDEHFELDSNIPDSAFGLDESRNKKDVEKPIKAFNSQSINSLAQRFPSNSQPYRKPINVAESDVFDGLSEIASSINVIGDAYGVNSTPNISPAFGWGLQNVPRKGKPVNQLQEITDVTEASEKARKTWRSTPPRSKSERSSKLSNNALSSDRVQGQFTPPMKQESVTTVRERIIKEDLIRNGKIPAFSSAVTIDQVEEDTDDESSQPQSIGISPIDSFAELNDSPSRSFQQEQLSYHLQLLTAESPIKTEANSISYERALSHTDRKDAVENIDDSDTLSKSDVRYPLIKEVAPDTLSSVRWVPSMIRLYGKKMTKAMAENLQLENINGKRFKNDTNRFNKKDSKSPRSVVEGEKNSFNFPTSLSNMNNDRSSTLFSQLSIACNSKFELTGIQTMNLYKNDIFGGMIKEPGSFVFNMIDNVMNPATKEHTRHPRQPRKHRWLHSFRKKNLFDEAIEIHKHALVCLESKEVEVAMEAYENFLDQHENHEFHLADKKTEIEVIGTFLHNVGVLHVFVGDFDLARNFLQQAVDYRKESQPGNGMHNRDVAVSLNEIGIAHFASGHYDDALKVFADVLAIWQKIDEDESYEMTKVLNNIGCTYFVLDEIDAALEAMSEALEIFRSFLIESIVKKTKWSAKLVTGVRTSLLGVSDTMCNMAHLFRFIGSTEEVFFLLEKATSIHKTLFDGECNEELLKLIESLSTKL